MRSTAVLLLIAALCTRVSAYRLYTFPRTPSKAAGRSRFESSSRTSSRRGSSNLGDKIDDPAVSRRTQRTIATPTATLARLRRKSGMAMSIFSSCLSYARECPQLVVGALCTAAATASFLSRCGDPPRRFEAPFMVSFCFVQHTNTPHRTCSSSTMHNCADNG